VGAVVFGVCKVLGEVLSFEVCVEVYRAVIGVLRE
jgi:hypothetical protein